MSHHRVIGFELVGLYRIRVDFEDETVQEIDFEPVLRGQLYGPLRDPMVFNSVTLDPEVHTLVWPNGADFDPTTLHDWPTLGAEFERMAKDWPEPRASVKAPASRLQ